MTPYGPNAGGAQAPRLGRGGGKLRRRTPYGQSGSFRGLKLVPAKRRYRVPPQAVNANR
ncbi:MAG TPA: hypothetical protein VFR47_13655 [Anaerolineales bacterium]|nr:hypothetical protein [Anaerolineales bacterium]